MPELVHHDKHQFILFAKNEGWPESVRDQAIEIYDNWRTRGAESVGFFLAGSSVSTKIQCLIPRYSDEETFKSHLKPDELADILQGEKLTATFHFGRSPLDSLDLIRVARKNYWSGEQILEIRDSEAVKAMNELENASEALKAVIRGRNRLETLFRLSKDYPSLNDQMIPQSVRIVESLQREYDELSGFSELQQRSHGLVVKISTPGHSKGKLPARLFSRLVSKFQDIIDNLDDGDISPDLGFYVVGLAPGSAALLADFEPLDPATPHEDTEKKIWDRLYLSLSAKRLLVTDSRNEAPSHASKFTAHLGVDTATASRIAESIQDLVPAPGDGVEMVTIGMPSSDFSTEFSLPDRKKMSSVKTYLKRNAKYKDGSTRIVRGECGEATEWSSKDLHRFKIKPADERQISIYYPATATDDERIKKSLQTNIKVRIQYQKGKWFLKDWLGG